MAGNIKAYVVDASFILSALLPDENLEEVDNLINQFTEGDAELYAPTLLPFEVLNGFKLALVRKRINSKQAVRLVKLYLSWDINYLKVDFYKIFILATKVGITIYDASYVWLAKSKKVKFLTLDENLQKLSK